MISMMMTLTMNLVMMMMLWTPVKVLQSLSDQASFLKRLQAPGDQLFATYFATVLIFAGLMIVVTMNTMMTTLPRTETMDTAMVMMIITAVDMVMMFMVVMVEDMVMVAMVDTRCSPRNQDLTAILHQTSNVRSQVRRCM